MPPPKDTQRQRDLVFNLESLLPQSPVGQGRGSSVIFLAHRVLQPRGHASFPPAGESPVRTLRLVSLFVPIFVGGRDGARQRKRTIKRNRTESRSTESLSVNFR